MSEPKKSCASTALFDKKKQSRKSRERKLSKMADAKNGTHETANTTRRPVADEVRKWQRTERAIDKEMRNFERVMAKEQRASKQD
jgi:hypothetical protein